MADRPEGPQAEENLERRREEDHLEDHQAEDPRAEDPLDGHQAGMSVTLSAKKVPITSSRSKTDDVRVRPSSTSGVPVDTGPLGEHAESRGAEEITEMCTKGVRRRASAEAPGLLQANLRRLEGKYPVAATLASIVSSMPPSDTTPTPGREMANVKVKAWTRAAGKGKGKDAPLGTMFRATWGEGMFEIPHGKTDWWASAQSSEWEPDWVSEEPTPPEEPRKHEWLKSCHSPMGSGTRTYMRGSRFAPRMTGPKLGLDETMDFLSGVLVVDDEDPDLSALSAAVKTKLGLTDLSKPPPTMSPGVELLTRDVKTCRGIRSS